MGVTIFDISGRNGTRERLLAAGESAMGGEGFETVALEAIAARAGQKNKYAVQYHFGDRIGLAKAIMEARLADVDDRRRTRRLAIGDADIAEILTAFLLPIADQINEEGVCSFALFLQQLALKERPWSSIDHPAAGYADGGTLALFDMLDEKITHVSRQSLGDRLSRLLHLPLLFFGELREPLLSDPSRLREFADIVAMMAAALAVPEQPSAPA